MPKIKFTKKDIIKATYEIMKQEGIKNISARKIASKFKGSTAPIYANFSTIEELKDEIIRLAEEKLNEYLNAIYTDKFSSITGRRSKTVSSQIMVFSLRICNFSMYKCYYGPDK